MGKGNRSRIERAMAESANAGKNVKAKKNKVSGAGIFVAIAALLVAIALLTGSVSMINEGGWFARSQTVVKTDNYRVTGTMMNYFFMTQFNSYYEYYYQMYQSYFSSSSTYSSAYDLMGIDPSKSFKDQFVSSAEGEEKVTVFDFYMSLTEDYVTQMLTYCEFANKEGIALDDDDLESIEKSVENLKSSYESQKAMYAQYGLSYYASFSAFLSANYGKGVNVNDIRECLKLITLAAKFEEKLNDEKEAELLSDETKEAIEQYVKDNPSKFLMADYYAYSFTVSSKNYKNDADFEAAKKEALEKAQKLAASEDKEAYKAAVLEMLKEAEKESYIEKNWATFLKENDNNEDLAKEAIEKSFEEKIWSEAMQTVKFDATLKTAYTYPTTHTDLSKWIFGYDASACEKGECDHEKEEDHEKSQEAAKEGDLTYFETNTETEETVKKEETTTTGADTSDTASEETTTEGAAAAAETTAEEESTTEAETTTEEESTTGSSSSATDKVKVNTYTVTVYLLNKSAYRNTEITKHFGYVMFTDKEDAEAFYAEYSKGEMNKDTMIEVLEKMHEADSTLSLYAYDAVEDYLPGDLQDQGFDKIDEWLETAEAGKDSGVIETVRTTETTGANNKTEEKKTTYYAVLVYDKDGYEYWFCDALAGATTEAVADWYEENKIEFDYNEKAYNFINVKLG